MAHLWTRDTCYIEVMTILVEGYDHKNVGN